MAAKPAARPARAAALRAGGAEGGGERAAALVIAASWRAQPALRRSAEESTSRVPDSARETFER